MSGNEAHIFVLHRSGYDAGGVPIAVFSSLEAAIAGSRAPNEVWTNDPDFPHERQTWRWDWPDEVYAEEITEFVLDRPRFDFGNPAPVPRALQAGDKVLGVAYIDETGEIQRDLMEITEETPNV